MKPNQQFTNENIAFLAKTIIVCLYCQESSCKYLLLTDFEGRTVSYGPSFFPSIYGPRASRLGHKSKGKNEDP